MKGLIKSLIYKFLNSDTVDAIVGMTLISKDTLFFYNRPSMHI